MVEHESGLAGVSGVTGDMKVLLEESGFDAPCALAVEMFCYQLRKFIGAYAAVLNGLDTLVFTGGIGGRAAQVREGVCRGLEFLGIELDESRNARNAEIITTDAFSCTVRLVHTDEDVINARHTRAVVAGRKLV